MGRIDLLTRKAEKCSSHLGEDTLVPDRFNLERQRTQQVQQLVQLHDQRVQAVNTPSKVPELLEESLKVFNSKNDEQQSDLRERAKRHNECCRKQNFEVAAGGVQKVETCQF